MPYNRPKKVIASIGGSSRGAAGSTVIVSNLEPTVRDDGSQLKQGDFWWSESDSLLYIYVGGQWEIAGNASQATFITLSWSSTAISANGNSVDNIIDADMVIGDSSTDASVDIVDTIRTVWQFDLENDGDFRSIDQLTQAEKDALGLIESTREDKTYYEMNGPLNGVDGFNTYPNAVSRVTVRGGNNNEFDIRGNSMPVWENGLYDNPICEGPGCGYNGHTFTTHNLKLQSPTSTTLGSRAVNHPAGYPDISNRETQEDANIFFSEALEYQLALIQGGAGGGGGAFNITAEAPIEVSESPAGTFDVSIKNSSVTERGSIQIATSDEVDAATDLLKAVTSKTVADHYLPLDWSKLGNLP